MTYRLTYTITTASHPDGLSKEEAEEQAGPLGGACDAVLIHSIIFPDDGSYSHLAYGLDGRTGQALSSKEMWKAWVMLAKQLADRRDLDEDEHLLCKMTFQHVMDELNRAKEPIEETP